MERYYGKTKRSVDSVTDEGTSRPSVRRKQSDADNGSLLSNQTQREINLDELPYDPADRKRVSEYTRNPKKQDEIRRRYLTRGPYRPPPGFNYPYRLIGDDQRRFNPQWLKKYGGWLEYSEKVDKAFCLCCYLFRDYNEGQAGTDAFAIKGWNGWNKKSRLDTHMGKGNVNSFHNVAVKRCDALMNQDQSIQVALNKQTDLTKKKNRIRLNASIDSVRYLLRQGLAFRGHDESKESKNKGNFRELVNTLANQNDDIRKVVLENAPENCQWICGDIQKELISYFAEITLSSITKEIGGDVFSLLIDEAADVSDKEQMAVVLRYLDKHAFIVGQDQSLQRAGDTRWGSHYRTLSGLVKLFPATISVLKYVAKEGKGDKKCQARGLVAYFETFEFVFYLHMMLHILGSANILSQSLQKKDQDILNAMSCVKSTRNELQDLRENGWDGLLEKSYLFCEEHKIQNANMQEDYVDRHAPRKKTNKTNLQHYQIECLNSVIDWQLQEFDDRFNEVNSALFSHMASFSPKDSFVAFNLESLVQLAKFYPEDFNSEKLDDLGHELVTYIDNVRADKRFANLDGIADLAKLMIETNKHVTFPLVNHLLKLVLILPVATSQVERIFSAMNVVKKKLRNKMGDEFMSDCLICYVEKDMFSTISNDQVFDMFKKIKNRQGKL